MTFDYVTVRGRHLSMGAFSQCGCFAQLYTRVDAKSQKRKKHGGNVDNLLSKKENEASEAVWRIASHGHKDHRNGTTDHDHMIPQQIAAVRAAPVAEQFSSTCAVRRLLRFCSASGLFAGRIPNCTVIRNLIFRFMDSSCLIF